MIAHETAPNETNYATVMLVITKNSATAASFEAIELAVLGEATIRHGRSRSVAAMQLY